MKGEEYRPTRCDAVAYDFTYFLYAYYYEMEARGGASVWGTGLQAERPRVRLSMLSFESLIDIIMESAQLISEMSSRNAYFV